MGQKVNPHGLREGIVKDWNSQWYEDDNNKNFSSERQIKDWNSTAPIYYFDFSAVRQFTRFVMQKVMKRLILPRQKLLA